MPDRLELFNLITAHTDPIVDEALVEALPSADIEAQRHIVTTIIDRGKANGLMGLIRHYHRLDGGLMHQINEKINLFASVLRNASRVADTQTVDNIITIIERTSSVDLAYLLAYLMPAGKAKVAERCAACLLELTHLTLDQNSRLTQSLEPAELHRKRAQVIEAVVYAAHQFGRHRQMGILEAVILLTPRRDAMLMKELEKTDQAIFQVLGNALSSPDQEIYLKYFWFVTAIPGMQEAAIQGLHYDFKEEDRMSLVENAHLSILKSSRDALFGMTSISVFIQPTLRMKRCPAGYSRKLVRMLKNMRLSNNERLVIYSRMIDSEDMITRLLVLRELLHVQEDMACEMILTLIYDPEIEIARIALRKAKKFTGDNRRLLMQMMDDCPHPTLRMLFQHFAPGEPFEEMWDHWPKMSGQNRMLISNRLLKQDPLFVTRLMDRRVATKEANDDNTQILDIARTTGINHSIVPALAQFATSKDERLASEAIRAMTTLSDVPEVKDVIVAGLYHDSDRVKGNVIEALEMYGDMSEYADRLVTIAKNRKQNRSRATAIKSLLGIEHEKAESLLMAMLQDDRPRHRVSALWVTKTMRMIHVIPQLKVMMETDPSPALRVRVRGILKALETDPLEEDPQLTEEAA